MSNSVNSRNPANSGSLAGTFQEILGKFLSGTDDMLPAKVIAYNRETNRAKVQPLIQLLKTDGTLVTRAQVASIPVFHLGGGGAVLTFNIVPGDLGWIKANDRDISLFLQRLNESAPNTNRKHNFSDAVFFPDQFRKWTLNEEDETNAVLQSLDGTKRIALFDDRVKITVEESDETGFASSDIVVTAGKIAMTTPLVTMSGDLQVAGTITGDTDVIAGTISGKTHTHGGVSSGTSNTAVPNP